VAVRESPEHHYSNSNRWHGNRRARFHQPWLFGKVPNRNKPANEGTGEVSSAVAAREEPEPTLWKYLMDIKEKPIIPLMQCNIMLRRKNSEEFSFHACRYML